jgi:hypothetical protein
VDSPPPEIAPAPVVSMPHVLRVLRTRGGVPDGLRHTPPRLSVKGQPGFKGLGTRGLGEFGHLPPRLTVPSMNVGSYASESVVQSSY